MVRLTDRPDMTLDVYRGRKTTMQQQQQYYYVFIYMGQKFCMVQVCVVIFEKIEAEKSEQMVQTSLSHYYTEKNN